MSIGEFGVFRKSASNPTGDHSRNPERPERDASGDVSPVNDNIFARSEHFANTVVTVLSALPFCPKVSPCGGSEQNGGPRTFRRQSRHQRHGCLPVIVRDPQRREIPQFFPLNPRIDK